MFVASYMYCYFPNLMQLWYALHVVCGLACFFQQVVSTEFDYQLFSDMDCEPYLVIQYNIGLLVRFIDHILGLVKK